MACIAISVYSMQTTFRCRGKNFFLENFNRKFTTYIAVCGDSFIPLLWAVIKNLILIRPMRITTDPSYSC